MLCFECKYICLLTCVVVFTWYARMATKSNNVRWSIDGRLSYSKNSENYGPLLPLTFAKYKDSAGWIVLTNSNGHCLLLTTRSWYLYVPAFISPQTELRLSWMVLLVLRAIVIQSWTKYNGSHMLCAVSVLEKEPSFQKLSFFFSIILSNWPSHVSNAQNLGR